MTRRLFALAVVLGLCTAPLALAAPPQGDYTIEFGPENGIFGFGETVQGVPGLGSFSTSFEANAAGQLAGAFELEIDDGELFGTIAGTFSGKASGKNGASKFKLKGRGTGVVSDGFFDLEVTLKLSFTVEGNAVTRVGRMSGKAKLCARGVGCEGGRFDPEFFELAPTDGPWTLDFTVDSTDPSRLTGTGIATLADGSEPVLYELTGKYSERKDVAKLTLRDATRKSKITLGKLEVADGEILAAGIAYKLKGQGGKKQIGAAAGGGGGPIPY